MHFPKLWSILFNRILKKDNYRLFQVLAGLGLLLTLIILFLNFKKNSAAEKIAQENANQITNQCQNNSEKSVCYARSFLDLDQKFTISVVLNTLEKVQQIDTKTNNCHMIAHMIAENEVKKDPEKWVDMFKVMKHPFLCFGGFVHGAVQGLGAVESVPIDEVVIEKKCTELARTINNQNFDPCVHGFGHVVFRQSKKDTNVAAEICSRLATSKLQDSCYDGMFMEMSSPVSKDEALHMMAHKDITQEHIEDIESVCRIFSGNAGTSCWRQMAHLYFPVFGTDVKKLKSACDRAGKASDIFACYVHSLTYAVIDLNFDENQLAEMCTPFQNNHQEWKDCYFWSIGALVYNSKYFSPRADKLCAQAQPEIKDYCYLTLKQQKADLGKVY